jgi:hypothetical protein
MANGTGHEDFALVAQADCYRRVHAGLVNLDNLVPDVVHSGLLQTYQAGIDLVFGVNGDNRVKVTRYRAELQDTFA